MWRPPGKQEVNAGSQYSDEEKEFLQAIQAYQKKHRRRFPAFTEILAIAKSLGYRKVAVEPSPEGQEEQ